MTFGGSGTHVRTVLSLQSQLNLEGSGGSENRCLCVVVFRCEKKDILEGSFVSFCGFRMPKIAHGVPNWLPI